MITKELVMGEEFYATDFTIAANSMRSQCSSCCLATSDGKSLGARCIEAECLPSQRPDGRRVVFVPADDVRTTMAFVLQQASKEQGVT